MKIIFLDIDGVLNSDRSILSMKKITNIDLPYYEKYAIASIDPIAVKLINLLALETSAKIVVSSSYRTHFLKDADGLSKLKTFMAKLGINEDLVIGMTRSLVLSSSNIKVIRGVEIDEWMNENDADSEISAFVIIDDSSDFMNSQIPYFERVDNVNGFSAQNYFNCRRILGTVT